MQVPDQYKLETPAITVLRAALEAPGLSRGEEADLLAKLNAAVQSRRAVVLDCLTEEILREGETLRGSLEPIFAAQHNLTRLSAIFETLFTRYVSAAGFARLEDDARARGPLIEVCAAFFGIFDEHTIGRFAAAVEKVRAARERSQR